MTDVEMRVMRHSHTQTDEGEPVYSVLFTDWSADLSKQGLSQIKLTLRSTDESLFKTYPLGRRVSLKLHDPQRKLGGAS
jgi:hypothetical protein